MSKKKAFYSHYHTGMETEKIGKAREKKLKQMAKGFRSRADLFRDWIDKAEIK